MLSNFAVVLLPYNRMRSIRKLTPMALVDFGIALLPDIALIPEVIFFSAPNAGENR